MSPVVAKSVLSGTEVLAGGGIGQKKPIGHSSEAVVGQDGEGTQETFSCVLEPSVEGRLSLVLLGGDSHLLYCRSHAFL